MPIKNFVGDMLDYESGNLSDLQILELFAHLIKTGLVWSLQGSYGRTGKAFIAEGFISDEGVITQHAYDTLSRIQAKPEVDPHNDWGITPEAFAAAQRGTKLATDRTYVVGIPLAVTVKGNGEIVLDFDLCEAYEFEPCDEGADQGVLRDDSNTVSHRLTRIRNHHRLTLPVPALKEIS